ncbi:hypothetical protein HanXRQr2_Chr10g0451381 [Helianthus annuus]|uniref:Uncharacterized protein n=1 Tax=Helianthus annuus TaxID=4232 RepID=A0A9K3HZ77_HELAN|nr:hypothetical protein HanXRQr2_Chr10g0451381 [Helianthus annuus]
MVLGSIPTRGVFPIFIGFPLELGKILAEIKKNQGMWERLLEEPPSSFRDAALDHIKE